MNIELPEAYQFLFKPSRYKIAYGGRGSAKSYSYSTAALIKGMQKKEKILAVREYMSSIADSVKSLLDRRISDIKLDWFYKSTNNAIIGRNGSEFIFAGITQNPSKIKSTDGVTICWIEEGQMITRRSIDILIPTIREPNSEIWVSMNTGLEDDPIYEDFIINERPDAIVKLINYYDNPFFPDVLRQEMEWCKEQDYKKYAHIWLGEPSNLSDSLVFTNWKIGQPQYDTSIDEFSDDVVPTIKRDTQYYFGLDFGYSVSPNVLVKVSIDEENRILYIHDERYDHQTEIDDLPAFIDSMPGAKDNYITADCARPETISHLIKKGYYIRPSIKGPGSIKEGIEFINNFQVIIDPKCKNTIYDFGHYAYEVDPKTDLIRPDRPPLKDNSDCPDAVRYSIELLRKKGHFTII